MYFLKMVIEDCFAAKCFVAEQSKAHLAQRWFPQYKGDTGFNPTKQHIFFIKILKYPEQYIWITLFNKKITGISIQIHVSTEYNVYTKINILGSAIFIGE